jgi:hypothetical protein
MKTHAILLSTLLLTLAACTVSRPPITNVSEAAFYTTSLSGSQSFYHDYLGYEQPYVFQADNGDTTAVSFKINDRQFITVIPDKTERESMLAWFLFETTDLKGMRKYLASKGIEVSPIQTNKFGNREFLFDSPSGYRMGFVEVRPGSTFVRDEGKYMSDRAVTKVMSHVGVGLYGREDVDKEMDFYLNTLDFEQGFTVPAAPADPTVIHLKMPEGPGKTMELLPYYSPITKRQLASRNHTCLEMEDIYPVLEMLQQRRPTTPHMRVGQNRKRTTDLQDVDGTRAEVMERLTVDEQEQLQK